MPRRNSPESSQLQTLYTGRSGHLAVVAQFLHRGYNAAIPEVDRGEDIFVIEDESGKLSRIQVKAANGHGVGRHYALYAVPLKQLEKKHTPELHYVFAIHYDGAWKDFLVIPRKDLFVLSRKRGMGRAHGENLYLRISFSANDVLCSKYSLQAYRNNWDPWPIIRH
jgi:hypothetical protein